MPERKMISIPSPPRISMYTKPKSSKNRRRHGLIQPQARPTEVVQETPPCEMQPHDYKKYVTGSPTRAREAFYRAPKRGA